MKQRVVVLGAGFAGLEFAKRFKGPETEVVVVDRQNHHLFQPLLYQVATAGLSAPEVAFPIRRILRRKKNLKVLLDEAVDIQLEDKKIQLQEYGTLRYDFLIIAVGARTNYFGNDQWEAFAPGLKSLDDATRMRHNVLLALEDAERTEDPEERKKLSTIVVVGGGPTGVELAGAFAELCKVVIKRDFKRIQPEDTRILLLEVADRILQPFAEELSAKAKAQLESLGVEVRLRQQIVDIDDDGVVLKEGRIPAANVFWGAGVCGSPLLEKLGIELDRAKRIPVLPDCSVPGHPDVFAIGDIVSLIDAKGNAVPGVSPAAMQMGRHVAGILSQELAQGRSRTPQERPAFRYLDKGMMATIGRSRAVAQIGKIRFSGFSAWMAWLAVHLVFLIGFRNKIAVLLQWCYAYIHYRRGARILTGLDAFFRIRNPRARPLSRIERKQSRVRGTNGAAHQELPPSNVSEK